MPDTQKYPHLPAELRRLAELDEKLINDTANNDDRDEWHSCSLRKVTLLLALANEAERLREENVGIKGLNIINEEHIATLEASLAAAEARVRELEDQITKGSWR